MFFSILERKDVKDGDQVRAGVCDWVSKAIQIN